ncbi:MAG TPA: alpha/beta fold hydrolase [Dehalococcoidia bacterium]|nr:alpha/beta fold hydrolase [Dehalococcoidia bacterium]
MRFHDRKDAGQRLAGLLKEKGFERPVVLGIPRGGLPVAAEVARALNGELAVVVARKLGAPGNPELAIGATTETGASYINTAVAAAVGADQRYIDAEKARQIAEAHRREQLFDSRRRPPVSGRTVIIVDDGIATGATAIAAVRSIKAEGAERVILAVPVGPTEMLELLRGEADEVVCLLDDPDFWAVGYYYDDFSQVSDDEVRQTLETFTAKMAAKAAIDPSRPTQMERDGIRLAGILTTPAPVGSFPLVIFVHGLGSSKESPRNLVIASRLVEAGIATLLFDLSDHGESSPDPRDGVDAYAADLEAVFAWARQQSEIVKDRIGIAGSSLGAVVAAKALADRKVSPRTMVLRAPPMEAADFRAVTVPSLVLIGSRDPLRRQVEAGTADQPQLTLSVVEGASHLFEEPGTLEEATQRTVEWFNSKLLQPAPSAARSGHG